MLHRRRFLATLGAIPLAGCAGKTPPISGTDPLGGVASAVSASVKFICGFEPLLPAVETLLQALFPGMAPALIPINQVATQICQSPTVPPTATHARMGRRAMMATGAVVIHYVSTPKGIILVPSR